MQKYQSIGAFGIHDIRANNDYVISTQHELFYEENI